ncbi:oligoendopeptidase F [soil metagenome]
MTTTTLRSRDDLDPVETWALEHLFDTASAFEDAIDDAEVRVAALGRDRGRLGDDAVTLHAFLDAFSRTTALLARLRTYATLPTSADGTDEEARVAAARFATTAARWGAALSFARPEILAIARERLAAFRRELPALERFGPWLDRLEADRAAVRSVEVEDVMASARAPLGALQRARQALVAGDMHFERVHAGGESLDVAPSTIRSLERHDDRGVRRQAFVSYADAHLAHADTLGELYLGRVQAQAFDARVRGYGSGEEAALAAMHVSASVLDATIDAFVDRLPVWHRYWEARRRLLAVERLEPWDVHASLAPGAPHVSVAQAVSWIVASAEPMGADYAERIREGMLEERWTDLRPNRGKREGAFCAAVPGVHPYILMSYTDDLPSASTLAHELGHAMHAELLHHTQDPLDSSDELGMTVAETASNAQQALLRAYLLAGPARGDERFELAVLDETLANFHRYLFVMPTLVRFEREVHAAHWRGEAPSGKALTRTMRERFQEGYGDAITADARVGSAWAQFGHLYVPFYSFQYAVGIAAATALVAPITAGEPGAADALHRFMRAGPSVPPIELFASVGLDVTTREPLDRAFDVLEGYVARLEELAP